MQNAPIFEGMGGSKLLSPGAGAAGALLLLLHLAGAGSNELTVIAGSCCLLLTLLLKLLSQPFCQAPMAQLAAPASERRG